MSSSTGDRHGLWTEKPSFHKVWGQHAAGKVQLAQVVSQFDRSPIGVVDCAEGFFREEHSDNASTTGSVQDQLDVASAAGSEQSCEELPALGETPQNVKKDIELPAQVHTSTQASCDVRPTFVQRSDGSFVMELPSINAEINTTCFATEALPTEIDFRPHIDVCIAFPEAQLLIFDPVTRTPAGMCMASSAHKCIKVLDVPLGFNLNAKLCAHSTSGKQTLKERLYTNGCRNMHADVDLNYELRFSGSVSTSNHQLVLEIDFAFRCWLSDSAMGYLHEGEWWGLVVTRSSDEVLSKPLGTDYELSYIEHRVEEIYDTLSSVSGSVSASRLSLLKAELAQLENNAEMCESLFHDACLDESRGGAQVADSPQKNILHRFLNLYQRFEKVQYKAVEVE